MPLHLRRWMSNANEINNSQRINEEKEIINKQSATKRAPKKTGNMEMKIDATVNY